MPGTAVDVVETSHAGDDFANIHRVDDEFEEEDDGGVCMAQDAEQYHFAIEQRLVEYEDFDGAMKIYEQMMNDCIKPLAETRIELVFYSPTVSDCLAILRDMNSSGDRPSTDVYNDVLRRCADCSLEYTARRMLAEMERFGVEPDVTTFCSVIRAIGE